MATLAHTTREVEGVALVHLAIETEVQARVTVEVTFDGPIWPPRTRGVPEAGWSDEGWTGVVTPDGPRVLGFATPASAPDPPARIVEATPTDDDSEGLTARAIVRTLGRQSPPKDAVPVEQGSDEASEDTAASRAVTASGSPVEATGEANRTSSPPEEPDPSISAIESRIERAERQADHGPRVASASTTPEPGDHSRSVADADRLVRRLERDRARLLAGADRRRALAGRIAEIDVPTAATEPDR